MTDYLRLAQERAPQVQDEQDNPYLPLAREQQSLQQNRARTVIEAALKDDPDLAAERLRLSRTSGLPLRVIERNLEELRVKERARAIDLVKMAEESPVLYRQLVDPTFTATSVDDLDTLKNLERAVGRGVAYVMGADGQGGLPSDLVGAAKTVGLGATVGVGKMIFDVAGVVNDLIGWDSGAAAARGAAKRAQGVMDEYGFQGGSSTRDAIRSGLQSAGTNLALLPVGLARGLWTTANQAASTVAGLVAAGVGADAFNRARAQGRTTVQSLTYAIPEATFEYVFERIPASKLFGDIAANTGLLKMIGHQALSEGWTEQVTTLAQDFNEWMNLNPDKTLAEFINERPEAAYQTFIATLVGVGVQTSTIKAINKIVEAASDRSLVYEQDLFQQQLQLAAASMLRARSPEQFREHIQRVVDANDGAKKEIYVDAEVLSQLPAELLAQLPESVREALPSALEANSTVAIPMADVLTVAPGTELGQILNDHARMRPNAPSRAEAELTAQLLAQDAERVLKQAADTAAWQQSANTVKQKILDQLNQAGRFTPDVNEAYATLQANFFSTMAARVGLTPQELYERYQLKVAAKSPGGQVLNSGRKLGEVEVEAFHYSRAPRPVVTTRAFGTGLQGSGREMYMNAQDRRLRHRAYFYVDKGTGINPEAGVGGIAHKTRLRNIYDSNADPLRLKQGRDQLAFESAVLDAGFDGYLDRLEGTQSGQVILLGDRAVKMEVLGPMGATRGEVVPGPQRTPAQGRDIVVEALQANRDLPMGEMSLSTWSMLLAKRMPEWTWTEGRAPDMPDQVLEQAPERGGVYNQGGPLLAPNGKPSNLSPALYAVVRTPEFKAWFGDWENDPANASKAVDENGEPKVYYHGSENAGFTEFDTEGKGKTRGTGAFFADSFSMAAGYSGSKKDAPVYTPEQIFADPSVIDGLEIEQEGVVVEVVVSSRGDTEWQWFANEEEALAELEFEPGEELDAKPGYRAYHPDFGEVTGTKEEILGYLDGMTVEPTPGVYAVFLNVRDLLTIDWQGNNWDDGPKEKVWNILDENGDVYDTVYSKEEADAALERNPGFTVEEAEQRQYDDTDDAARQGRDTGVDGVLIKNVWDTGPKGYAEHGDVMVVYKPENIKEIRNRGTFDPEDPNILKQSPLPELPETVEVDGVERPTRNSAGQLIHHTEEGIRNFWLWFGDSKVVDERGRPLVVYHGTNADFNEFDPEAQGSSGQGSGEPGFFFEASPENAGRYTRQGDGANVIPAYLSLKNPLVVERTNTKYDYDGSYSRVAFANFIDDALELGHDGVIFRDVLDRGKRSTQYVAFRSEQIKSAIGNNGQFDPANPNILKQGPRGTFNPERLLITLNENADLSTFLHESGHFFLEVMADLASQPNAPQQIVDDMAAILKWFGIKGDERVGGSDSGAPLAQQDAEAVSEAIYKEMAADDELVAALEAWMVDGTQPDAAMNEKLLGYMRRMPPVPKDSYLTFYRGQPRGVAPHSRGWASWTTNPDTTRFFTEGDSEVLQRKGVQGISLEQIALWRTRLTGELTDYGSQGEWLVLNESVFAQGGDLPTDTTKPAGRTPLEVWNAMTLDQKRPYHERWAEAFEQYLFEGKAPSQELQPLFRRFRSWLINVYKSLKQFMLGRNLQVSDDIRKVFDRMIATDEEIAQAEEAAGMLPDFEATNEAIEKLQARSLRDLKWAVNARNKTIKALQKQAAKLRKEVEAEVRAEVEQQPVYRAMRWLKKGETIDPETGDLVKAEKGFRLNTDALAEMYPETMPDRPDLTRLRGMTAKNGVHPDVAADMFGFASGDQLVRAILDAQPINEVIEGMADQRMLERYGDLATPEAREAAANEAVHNEARARALATELKSQAEMINQRQDTGRRDARGRAITVNAVVEAAKQFGLNLAARRRIKDLKNAAWQHRAAEARAGKRWQQLTAEGKTEEAVQAKRDQLLNNYAAKALQDAQAEAKKILEFFRKVTKGNNEKIVERGRDPDVVNAMRAILAAYGVAPRLEKSALEYMEVVAKNDPAMYAALKPSVDAALFNAKPLDELTMEELRGLNDELRAMWELAKRSRQMEVDGNLLDIEEAADELVKRMEEIGIPAEIPGERAAITDREEAGIKLQFVKAILSRVEQWAERMDGKFGGPFLRLVFQPIKEAADAYRTARVEYRKRFTALVENIAPILRPGPIHAPELNYTFGNARDSGQAELLHAILHTGNESNKRKLLLGRGWGTELEDGTLDTSRWDAFIARMIAEGKITKAHYDFAQGVWDLLEEMKPLAQETHRKVFGRYFAEVTATPFDTPFGSYRGGYVPAQVDPRIVKDAKLRELAETENESMAYAFPASPSGFTKARVEYNKPLLLDLRALAQHIDKVLLFSYMQGPVTDVRRLLTNKRVSYVLDRIDPGAYEGMLIPWLNRAAKQIVETPVAGDRKLSRFLSAARSRAGMALMFANLSNTVQQITGFSLAAVKVKPSLMMKATASFIAGPKAMKEQVAAASEYMRNRMLNEVAAMNDAVEQILVNATALEKAQAWTQRHAYFLQAAVDNTMSPIIWTAAYNQAIEQKMSHKDAVRFADGVIRQTQGTSLPEDISRFESGPAYARLFTQFVSYFNMMANTNATAVKQIADEMGLRKGAGKLLYVALAGLLVPIWVAEAIAQAFRGGPDDEDDDGYLDDWLMAVFGLGTLRGMVAQVPIVGQAAQLAVNRFNDNPADDKFSLSPAVSLLESAVSSPASVYKAIVEEGSAQKAARDVAAAATLITGLPIYAAARPVGYLAGMADGRIEPTGPVDLARGLVTGVASPESRVP